MIHLDDEIIPNLGVAKMRYTQHGGCSQRNPSKYRNKNKKEE